MITLEPQRSKYSTVAGRQSATIANSTISAGLDQGAGLRNSYLSQVKQEDVEMYGDPSRELTGTRASTASFGNNGATFSHKNRTTRKVSKKNSLLSTPSQVEYMNPTLAATVPQRQGRRNINIAADGEVQSYIQKCIEDAEGANTNEVWNQIQNATDVRNEVQEVLSMLKNNGGVQTNADAIADREIISLRQEL